jgi:O-antigen ligase
MDNWRDNPINIVLSFVVAIMFALFLLLCAPIFFLKPVFILLFPVAILLMFLLFIRPEMCFLFIFVARSSLDNIFQNTKLPLLGNVAGFGAVCNILLIFLLIVFILRRPDIFKKIPLKWSWAIFLFIMATTVTYSADKIGGIKLVENFISYFAMFSLPFFLIRNQKDKQYWFGVFVFSFVIPVLIANFYFLHRDRIDPHAGFRLAGTFTHPNILAFYLILGIAVIFFALRDSHFVIGKGRREALFFLIFIMFFQLLATKTRNAWAAAWLMALFYGFYKDRRFIFVCLGVIPLALLVPAVHDRIVDLFANSGRTLEQGMNSWEWRLKVWQSSMEMISKRPIFGYGLSSFVPLSVDFFRSSDGIGAHNSYLQLLFEGGVVGLGVFLFLFIGAWRLLSRAWKKTKSSGHAIALVYLFSYLIICAADNLLYYLVLNWYVWFFIGFVLRDTELQQEREEQNCVQPSR